MLGYLLYEAVEVTYTVTKLLYNGISGTYLWYYGMENLTEDEKKIKELEDLELKKDEIIKNLENRIIVLENKIF